MPLILFLKVLFCVPFLLCPELVVPPLIHIGEEVYQLPYPNHNFSIKRTDFSPNENIHTA
jgi:hypothetical protein